MYYSITGKNIILFPLYEEKSLALLLQLCEKKDFRESSLVYSDELNFWDSMYRFGELGLDDKYWKKQLLYVIANMEGTEAYGIVGLKDIDYLQRRAELVVILLDEASKKKILYEPLKHLLAMVIKEWQFRRLWIRVKAADTPTTTVCKGFGFAVEGKLREDVRIGAETLDVNILGLLDHEFHSVENV